MKINRITMLSDAIEGDVIEITEPLALTKYDSQAAELIEMMLKRWPEITFGDASILLDTARWWIVLWGSSSKAHRAHRLVKEAQGEAQGEAS